MSKDIDCIVVGAGVVGLAIGRALAMSGREVMIVEAAEGIGTGTSARNSEVIHAGIYYPKGSLKARLCVKGKQLLYAYCKARGVGHQQLGKLIVATSESENAMLAQIRQKAHDNGVTDLELLTAEQAQSLEPALSCTAALISPSTGIVDSHALMLALHGTVQAAGGTVALRTRMLGARPHDSGGLQVDLLSVGQPLQVHTRWLINAAGVHACAVAARVERLSPAQVPRAHFAKGHYFSLPGAPAFSHLIYPVPVDAWLGVHLTLDMAGQMRFGPDLQWLDCTDPDGLDYGVDAGRAALFEAAVRQYWPGLPAGRLQPAYSGVRPRIHGPDEAAPDFRIDGPQQHGVDGLVNLFGIESPGLTAALALAEWVWQTQVQPGAGVAA